jgi:hypothetical protein
MAVADHPTPQQVHLLEIVESLHVDPEDLAENLSALAGLHSFAVTDQGRPAMDLAHAPTTEAISALLPSIALNSLAETIQKSAHSLGAAMAASPNTVSPQLARSLQAAENIWRRIDHEFGLLTSVQVASLLTLKPTRTPAAQLRSDGKIVGVLRGNSYRFPGFQFDKARGAVRPVMANLITLARDNGRSDEDLVFWMTSPSSYFHEEDRPVDHLDEEERVLAAAQDQFEGTW